MLIQPSMVTHWEGIIKQLILMEWGFGWDGEAKRAGDFGIATLKLGSAGWVDSIAIPGRLWAWQSQCCQRRWSHRWGLPTSPSRLRPTGHMCRNLDGSLILYSFVIMTQFCDHESWHYYKLDDGCVSPWEPFQGGPLHVFYLNFF